MRGWQVRRGKGGLMREVCEVLQKGRVGELRWGRIGKMWESKGKLGEARNWG